jgi:hypothetical protein
MFDCLQVMNVGDLISLSEYCETLRNKEVCLFRQYINNSFVDVNKQLLPVAEWDELFQLMEQDFKEFCVYQPFE